MFVDGIQLIKSDGITVNLTRYLLLVSDGEETRVMYHGEALFGYDYEIIAWQNDGSRPDPDKWQYLNPEDDPKK